MTNQTKMAYRKDVQVLRGIAVLLVVLFHLNVPGFHSGFLGVDVFFVISGYLMAVMYDPAHKAEFFSKRASRLLPAYFATVLCTLLVGLLVTNPNEFSQITTQAGFATVFASNLGFWLENSYFDKVAFKPLLHLWSLGVEIQFYLMIPALHWLLKKTRFPGYAVITGSSALLCFLVVGISPKTAFFWLPLRLWQFLFGYGVAVVLSRRAAAFSPRTTSVGTACLGVILLLPFVPVNGEATSFWSGHPGLASLAISVATALTLLFGVSKTVLSNPGAATLEGLGNYSYSIYLAHFPIIVLFLYKPFSGTSLTTSGPVQFVVLALLVVAAAALLYRLVESRFRHVQLSTPWAAGAVCMICALTVGGGVLQSMVLPRSELDIYEAWTDRATYRCGKLSRILNPKNLSCETTASVKNPTARILLVGNSHADSIKATFSQTAEAQGATVYFMVENNPLLEGGIDAQNLVKEALDRKADAIVLHYSPDSIAPGVIGQVVRLARQNSVRVSFIMPVPTWDRHVPKMLWQELKNGVPRSTQDISDYESRRRSLTEALSLIDPTNFKVYKVAAAMCPETCQLTKAGKPLYFDSNHLTLTGSEMLRPVFDKVIFDVRLPVGSPPLEQPESISARAAPPCLRPCGIGVGGSWKRE